MSYVELQPWTIDFDEILPDHMIHMYSRKLVLLPLVLLPLVCYLQSAKTPEIDLPKCCGTPLEHCDILCSIDCSKYIWRLKFIYFCAKIK